MTRLNGIDMTIDYVSAVRKHEGLLKSKMREVNDLCIEFEDFGILLQEMKKEVEKRFNAMLSADNYPSDTEYKEELAEYKEFLDSFTSSINDAKKQVKSITDKQYASC